MMRPSHSLAVNDRLTNCTTDTPSMNRKCRSIEGRLALQLLLLLVLVVQSSLDLFNKTKMTVQDSEGPYPAEKSIEKSPVAA